MNTNDIHTIPGEDKVERAGENVQRLTYELIRAKKQQVSSALLLVLPFILVFALIVSGLGTTSYLLFSSEIKGVTTHAYYGIVLIFFLILALIPSVLSQLRVRSMEDVLDEAKNELAEVSLSLPIARLGYLQTQQIELTARAAKINWIDKRKRNYSDKLRKEIGEALAKLEEEEKHEGRAKKEEKKFLGEIIPQWDSIHFGLTQWSELIDDEEHRQEDEKKWKVMSVAIAILYLVALLLAIPSFNPENTVFGVPLPIIIWSAVGSLAAILYRFYKAGRQIIFETEFRWLIARPIIGIVMGTLAYLALFSGLLIFEADSASSETIAKTGQLAQYWIVAFLAGFSDKFYEKIIELLVGKFGTVKSDNETKSDKNDIEASQDAVEEGKSF